MSTQLPAEWQQKIREKAFDYLKRRFDGQQSTTPSILDDSPDTHFAAGYAACVAELVEAQGRIKTLEDGINELITHMETWRQMCVDEMAKAKSLDDVDIGYQLAGRSKAEYDGILPKLKALLPDNKLKEDE